MRHSLALALTTTLLAAPTAAFASTWELDASHSEIGFSVRHMMVSNTKGRFSTAKGTLTVDDKDVTKSSITVEIDAASIDTRETKRDDHLKSPDFFDVAKFPKLTFKSKSVSKDGEGLKIEGDLTIKGVTKPVTLKATALSAPAKSTFGMTVRGVSASTKINRKDFGLGWNKALEAGGVVVGEEVTITIEAEFVQK
jgi:polyisoprenoid-binding protein YceI